MKFHFSDIENKETLLAKYSEEEIMETIMGIEVQEERFCSPFRNDERPTCSLWRAPGNGCLYFMDWATLNHPVDVFGLYMYAHGCEFNDALNGIWQMMSGVSPTGAPYASPFTPPTEDINTLKAQAEILEDQLEEIKRRIEELEEKK